MKKYQFFQWVFFCLLLSINFNLKAQYITYPVNGSVFQQNSSGQATVNFSFSEINSYNKTIFYRIKKADGTVIKNRVVLSTTTFTNGGGLKGYHATELLDKGWYTVEFYHEWQFCFLFICGKPSNRMVESKEFGVGDVYFVAGQSNASGFNQSTVDEVTTYSSQNSLDLGGGNIRNHSNNPIVRTLNSSDNNDITKGLPNGSGFVNLTKSEMPIYPNGISSWCWAPLGNEFANHNQTPTIFFNIALPNTSLVYDWVGYPSKKDKNSSTELIGKFYQTLGFYGNILGAKSVLWHQGERDSQILAGYGNPPSDIITNNYNSYLAELINFSRSNTGLSDLPWFVSKVSYTSRGDNNSNSCIAPNAQYPQYTTLTGYKDKYDRSDLKSYQVKNGDSKVFQGVTSDFIDDDDWEGNSTNFSSSTTECVVRAPMQRIHFTGDWLGKLGHAWHKAISNNYSNATGKPATQLLKLNSVSKSGNNFTFTVETPPSGAIIYYWCKNDAGINNSPSTTSSTSPTISLNAGDRVICYAKDNIGKFYSSQPYIRNDCSNCRPGGSSTFSISPLSLNFSASGETKSINFDGAINDWEIANAPSWITDVNWDDYNQKLNITASNNNGAYRNGTIEFVEVGTGNSLATLSITQSATTGCSQTNLTSLTPTNSSGEWQGYGTRQLNKSIDGNTLMVGGYQTGNGIGTHANSTMIYNLSGQYGTFSFRVGRDDESDNCGCGNMKLQFKVYVDNVLKFTSPLLGTTDAAYPQAPQTIDVTGANTLKLEVNDGGDNFWGDHADWLDPVLFCGTPPSCTTAPPAPTNVSSSPATISSGGSSTLSATCATGTVTWSTGAVGNSISVSPTVSTNYSVSCVSGSCPQSNAVSVGVTVSTGACSAISDNLVMGTWNATGQQLVARFFNGQYWFTQRTGTNPDAFVVRGSGMLQRSDVSLANGSYYNLVGCFSWTYSNYDNLGNPPSSVFSTPAGYSLGYAQDGTMFYTATTGGGGGGGSCTDAYVTNAWVSATIGYGSTPQIGHRFDGGAMVIGSTTYTQGIGTHAGSEIIYNFTNNPYANFKASVGRDADANGCNCGTQTIVFKVYNNTTGALIGGTNNPVTKTANQSASDMVVPIAGVASIRLVVEDGGDQIWGDHADWGNARFTCANSNGRQSVEPQTPTEETIEGLEMFPNPTNDKLTTKFILAENSKISFEIIDMQGRNLENYQYKGEAGIHTFIMDVSKIHAGNYLLRSVLGNKLEVRKFVIER